jgi:cytochrome P450
MSIAKTKPSLDFTSDEFLADPWPIYRELRNADPIHWSAAFQAFLVTRLEDVAALLQDRRVVSGFPMRSSRRLFGPTLLDADGTSHRELRKMFMPMFAGSSVRRLRTEILVPAVNQVLDSISAEMGDADHVDIEFMERVAVGVPYAMVTRLFGLPPEDAAWLRPRVLPLAGAIEFPATSLDMALAAKAELIDYLTEALAKRQPDGRMTFLDVLFPKANRLTNPGWARRRCSCWPERRRVSPPSARSCTPYSLTTSNCRGWRTPNSATRWFGRPCGGNRQVTPS